MSRNKKLIMNSISGIVKQFVAIICGFILSKYMLTYYGAAVNGLVSSVTNFLGFISLLDLGVGAVIQASLYKPLVNKDTDMISSIVFASKKFFYRLGFIFLGYVVFLCVVYPSFSEIRFGRLGTTLLIIIISISTLSQYLFGMTYQLLLNSDQKGFIPQTIQTITIIINTVFSVVLMKMGLGVHAVKLMTSIIYLFRPILQIAYVRNNYIINRRIQIESDPIKQKWNGLTQHLAYVICTNIDIAVLTIFSSLENISIYSLYYNVINGLKLMIISVSSGSEAFLGNTIAINETKQLMDSFLFIELSTHYIVTILFSIATITIIPFIKIYTAGIIDVNYIQPLFGTILVLAYFTECLRLPYFSLLKAAGHFKQTQNGALISAIINMVITIILVFQFGIVGTAIGTLAAMIYHTTYILWYLQNNIISQNIRHFFKLFFSDAVCILLSYYASRYLPFRVLTYYGWVLYTITVGILSTIITSTVFTVTFRRDAKNAKNLLCSSLFLKKKSRYIGDEGK